MRETERIVPLLSPSHFPLNTMVGTDELSARLKRYESLTEVLRAMVTTGCFWGSNEQAVLWVKVLNRVANAYAPTGGMVAWVNLRLYPSLLVLYTGGMAAVAAGNFAAFRMLLTEPRVRDLAGEEHVFVNQVNQRAEVIDWNLMRRLPGLQGHKTPTSEYLFRLLRNPLRESLPDDVAYQRCFYRFEYFLGLVHVDLNNSTVWAPLGCFIWRGGFIRRPEDSVGARLKAEIDQAGWFTSTSPRA